MIISISLLALVSLLAVVEKFINPLPTRIAANAIIIIVSFGIALNAGMRLGKNVQANRFSRSLPQIVNILETMEGRAPETSSALTYLRSELGDPNKLENIELIVGELESMNEK